MPGKRARVVRRRAARKRSFPAGSPPRRAAYPVIRLPRSARSPPTDSYLTRLSGGGTSLTMRVVEYHISVDGQTTPELFCLVTDLLDHTTHPAHQLAQAYRWRWDGSETALREAKSAIHDAGPAPGRSCAHTTPS